MVGFKIIRERLDILERLGRWYLIGVLLSIVLKCISYGEVFIVVCFDDFLFIKFVVIYIYFYLLLF